jgi:hypothetical protein
MDGSAIHNDGDMSYGSLEPKKTCTDIKSVAVGVFGVSLMLGDFVVSKIEVGNEPAVA